MARLLALGASVLLAVATLAPDARGATDSEIALSEVVPPPPSAGVDQATLKLAAEGEIKRIDGSRARAKGKRVLVSVALMGGEDAPVSFTVNATLRDAKSGAMIAIVEGRARAEGSATKDLKRQVAHAAVRSALRQIPDALAN